MKFGKYWESHVVSQWKEYYIDYPMLKKIIRCADAGEAGTLFNHTTEDEVHKAIEFYNFQRRNLERDIVTAKKAQRLLETKAGNGQDLIDQLYDIGDRIISLFEFLSLNAEALRKIFKKFKKQVYNSKLLDEMVLSTKPVFARNLSILQDCSLLELSVGFVKKSLMDILPENVPTDRFQTFLQDVASVQQSFEKKSNFLVFLRKQSFVPWRTHIVRSQSSILPHGDWMSEYINLFSTFFYLCNYNITLPTAGQYAVALGLSKTSSGIIVAMTPIAAILSAIGYSYWTNFSFKSPLLCSSTLLICGNLCYAAAFDANIPLMIFAGRFICGLGGARVVNRRWIADNISVDNRTKSSALFVAAGALGMSFGPLIAAAFEGSDFKIFGRFTFNEMTGPGWCMACIWFFYGMIVIFFFKDNRSGFRQVELLSDDEEITDEDDDSPADGFDDGIDIVLSPINNYGTIEKQPGIISNRSLFSKVRRSKTVKTVLCLWIIFWVKLQQEALLTELPIVSFEFYIWGSARTGIFMAFLGVAVVPMNLIVIQIAGVFRLRDPIIIRWLHIPIVVSCIMLVPFSDQPLKLRNYIASSTVLFCFAQVIEGVAMSFFSKIISKKLAQGTWNSGLLATEAGTIGRACGNALITVLGEGTTFQLERTMYSFEFIVSLFSLAATFVCMA